MLQEYWRSCWMIQTVYTRGLIFDMFSVHPRECALELCFIMYGFFPIESLTRNWGYAAERLYWDVADSYCKMEMRSEARGVLWSDSEFLIPWIFWGIKWNWFFFNMSPLEVQARHCFMCRVGSRQVGASKWILSVTSQVVIYRHA